jgi:hypothetical protein
VAATQTVTYSTTPPANPNDGDQWILPADPTAGVNWRFCFNASSASAYRWEFIGGPSLAAGPAGSMTVTTTTLTDLTGGPTRTLARAGDYIIDFGAAAQASGNFAAYNISVYLSDGVQTGDPITFTPVNAQYMGGTLSGIQIRTGLVAGTVLKLQAAAQNSNPSNVTNGWMKVMPRRIS